MMCEERQKDVAPEAAGTTPLFLGFLLILIFFFVASTVTAAEKPKRLQNVKQPGQCSACHGKEKALPAEHPDTKGMNYQACLPCHDAAGDQTLRTKLPLGHIHMLKGITCEKCHGKAKKQAALTMAQCVACHGSTDKLAEKTAKVKPENPHTSPHYGTSLDCNVCHHQHGKSENFCSQCHNFKYKVP